MANALVAHVVSDKYIVLSHDNKHNLQLN